MYVSVSICECVCVHFCNEQVDKLILQGLAPTCHIDEKKNEK